MTDQRPDDVIDAYLAGELSPEHAAQVRAYLDEHPGRRGTVAGFLATARGEDLGARPSVETSLAQLFARLDQDNQANGAHTTRQPSHTRGTARRSGSHPLASRPVWQRLATGGLGVIAVVMLALHLPYRQVAVAPPIVYATAVGERTVVHLADGTRATLAPNTTLSVPSTFGRENRTIALRGEAYFDVVKHDTSPFIVTTGSINTQVLGTTFDVKQYATDRAVRIVVTQGKVQSTARHTSSRPTTLAAGMIGYITDSTATVVATEDAAAYTSWTDGRLDFNQAPVPEVLATMERWYGFRFRLADSALATLKVSGSLDFRTKSAALNVLKSLLDVRMTFDRSGDTTIVVLHARNTSSGNVLPIRRPMPRPQMEVGL